MKELSKNKKAATAAKKTLKKQVSSPQNKYHKRLSIINKRIK